MAQRKFTKALDEFLKDIDTQIFSLKKELEISQTETKLYKTLLLEEKSKSIKDNSLFILVSNERSYGESNACVGVFTLESLAIKALIKGIAEFNKYIKDFSIHCIELKGPVTKDSVSVLIQALDGTSDNESVVVGLKVNNETTFLYGKTEDFYEEKYILDEINEDYLDW